MSACLAIVGSIRADLIVRMDVLPGPGQSVPATSFERHSGGRGLSQAAAAAALGARASLIACIGEDEFGPWLHGIADGVGIETTFVRSVPGSSGVAVIEVETEGVQRTAQVPGANDLIDADQVARDIAGMSQLDMVLGQAELPLPVTAAAFSAARSRGARTMLNASPFSPGLIEGLEILYPLIDVIVLEASVASAITGLATDAAVDADEAAQAIVDRGVLRVVITRRHRGAVWRAPNGAGSIPVTPARMVDTMGAGSAFCSGLAVGLAEGQSFAESLRLASATSALSTTVTGSVRNMPTREAVEELLALRG